jgi:hypothetical protein
VRIDDFEGKVMGKHILTDDDILEGQRVGVHKE